MWKAGCDDLCLLTRLPSADGLDSGYGKSVISSRFSEQHPPNKLPRLPLPGGENRAVRHEHGVQISHVDFFGDMTARGSFRAGMGLEA